MAQLCKICNHPKRKQIESNVNANVNDLKSIANEYGVAYMQLYRHRQNHMGPSQEHQAAMGASQMETTAIAELKATEIPDLPDDYKPKPGQIDAYRDMLFLRDKAVKLIETVEASANTGEDGEGGKVSVYEMAIAMKELRETTKAMVSVYEAQKRIEAEYSPPETIQASYVYQWLKKTYPAVLLELVAAVKAAR
jgi:hypothetical protein